GYGEGQFNGPVGIAVDGNRNIYVADRWNNRVQKFTLSGSFLGSWGSEGDSVGQFQWPEGIVVDSNGFVYVADTFNHRVQKFTSSGGFLAVWGDEGSTEGQFSGPFDIAVDGSGNVFVADSWNNRVQRFSAAGGFLGAWGNRGKNEGQFLFPESLAVDGSGNVYLSDTYNNRIQVFTKGLPGLDPRSGLALNGSFESSPALTEWTYGGPLPVSRSTNAAHGSYSLQLGKTVSQTEQGLGDAWAHTTFYVRPEWDRPMLSFKYNMFVNDIMDYSDFFVAIQDGVGLNHLQTVLRDGYQPCTPGVAPAAGTNLGWRTARFDLSAYKGQHIRLVFSNRNLWPISWGIWTYVDDVRVIDAGPLPTIDNPYISYLPLVSYSYCDPVLNRDRDADSELLTRPAIP
ncbi:MAG: hypothetical protein K0B14_15515, partial [Anaerolineaceae bacterium]|nr:hypothetical protein [Anaerolineaceae bacterium]